MALRTRSKPQLRGIIYGRQSRTKDGSESIDQQLVACRSAASSFGVQVVEEIVEPPSTSAYKARGKERPRFPELLAKVRAGQVDVVIVYKTDRLSRGGGPGWAPLWDAVDEAANGIDLDRFVLTPDGYKSEFELGIRATMDREESRKTSDRLTAMKDHHATQGRPTGGGHRPYGYLADTTTVDESEATILREVVNRYLEGEGMKSIVRWLNDTGHATTTGGLWQEGSLRNVLANPRITGLRVHRGEVVGEATWPAIIDRPTWERLKARLDARARGALPGPSKYLLNGLVFCHRCGGRMYGAMIGGRDRYRCSKAPGKVNCGNTVIVAEPVDDHITAATLFRLDSPAVLNASRPPASPGVDLSELAREIQAYEGRLDQASVMFADGEIDRKAFLAVRNQIEEQLRQLRSTVATSEGARTISSFVDAGQDLEAMWRDAVVGRRQEILRAVIDRVVINAAPIRGSKIVDLNRVQIDWRV